MPNNAAIENFINKVRLAQTTKSKDIRITIEEATDLVASIALINASNDMIISLNNKVDKVSRKLDGLQTGQQTPHIDGGSFKG